MPLWEWILVIAFVAIPITAVMVARLLNTEQQPVRAATSAPCAPLRVPSFVTPR